MDRQSRVPVSTWGLPIWKWVGRQKKHMGTPRFHTVFVTIWGLTYTYSFLTHDAGLSVDDFLVHLQKNAGA
jgi:hypothetical protein